MTWTWVCANQIVNALNERNRIEKAKPAEMRAARMLADPMEHQAKVENATAEADRLTAEVLGEEENAND